MWQHFEIYFHTYCCCVCWLFYKVRACFSLSATTRHVLSRLSHSEVRRVAVFKTEHKNRLKIAVAHTRDPGSLVCGNCTGLQRRQNRLNNGCKMTRNTRRRGGWGLKEKSKGEWRRDVWNWECDIPFTAFLKCFQCEFAHKRLVAADETHCTADIEGFIWPGSFFPSSVTTAAGSEPFGWELAST